MESFLLSINAVLPMFILMCLGYWFKQKQLFTAQTRKQMNRVTFLVFLPILLFYNICTTDIRKGFEGKAVAVAMLSLLGLFGILWLVVPKVVKDPKQKGVIIQGLFRSNYVLFGVSIVTNLYGAGESGLASVLSAFLVPCYNFLAVLSLSFFSEGKPNWNKIGRDILTNPLIIAGIAGIIVSWNGWVFPDCINTVTKQLGALATPLAFIVLGGDFEVSALHGRIGKAVAVCLLKLLFIPALMIPLVVWMGFTGNELLALVLAWASPIAVSSYTMAQHAGADEQLAGQLVMVSSVLSIVTIFFWVYTLSAFGLL